MKGKEYEGRRKEEQKGDREKIDIWIEVKGVKTEKGRDAK